MRRQLSLILALILLLSLAGCSIQSDDTNKTALFYYTWANPDVKMEKEPNSGAIGFERRETAGHGGDLTYLLSLYLQGPLDAELKSPFPKSCRLLEAVVSGDTLRITLDSSFTKLENTQLTLACACLAKTSFALTDATQVQIKAAAPDSTGSVDITIGTDSLLLRDDSAQTTTEESQ